MRIVRDNFPDEVWGRLKAWAREQAAAGASPSHDESAAHVERVAEEITGQRAALRPDVVEFYAAETADMIAKFRDQLQVPSGGAGRTEPEAAI